MATKTENAIPRIPLNLRQHKRGIAVTWAVLFMSSCAMPILLYFILKYVASLKANAVAGIPSGVFGVVSLLSYFQRLYSLTRRNSTTRPIGGSRWTLDSSWTPPTADVTDFQYNFTLGFCYITALITYASASKPAHLRVVALPLSLLILQVSLQILIAWVMRLAGLRYPFRLSSLRKGDAVRPAIYTIIEDIVAVDGKQGTAYRASLSQAYEGRQAVRAILCRLDLLWGVSGVCVGGMNVALIFALKNVDIAWVVGWSIPWAWVVVCTILSIIETRAMCKLENKGLTNGFTHGDMNGDMGMGKHFA